MLTNSSNTASRWAEALRYYSKHTKETLSRYEGRVAIKAVIDVSSSMSGCKLIAVKLGLCAILSRLQRGDLMNITSFSTEINDITSGFVPVTSLHRSLPSMLENINADGTTACYDAALAGITDLSNLTQAQTMSRTSSQRNVLILLTDGEDNSSENSANSVCAALVEPGFDNFMFILVAVEMKATEEKIFQPWVSMRHCKQVSVSVNTGAMLLRVFEEVLMNRVLQTKDDSYRLYHRKYLADDGNMYCQSFFFFVGASPSIS